MTKENGPPNDVRHLLTLAKHYKSSLTVAEGYNLFKVLRSPSDEVRLHSRFLGDIFNINGLHGLGVKPLKLLLQILNVTPINDNFNFEMHVEHKNIDLYLVNNATKQALIIENKIYALDQEQQLLRYYNTAISEGYTDVTIVYLTLYGNEPSHYSLKGDRGELKHPIVTISYKNDISKLIERLAGQSVQFPALRESLIQYLDIIKGLTGMTTNALYIKELKQLLLDTRAVDVVAPLQEALQELKYDAISNLFAMLATKVESRFGSLIIGSVVDHESAYAAVTSYCSRGGVRSVTVGFPLPSYPGCELAVQLEGGERLFIGIQNDPENQNERLRSIGPISGYHSDEQWWPVYKYVNFDGYWNLNILSPSEVMKLHEPSFLQEFTDYIVQEMEFLRSTL
ncbi:PDDEXK-like family protein [Vibrio sp. PNB22_4_1]